MTESTTNNISRGRRSYKWLLGAFWAMFSLGVIATVLLFALIKQGKIGYMPDYEQIENPTDKFATRVFSDDHKLLFKYFNSDHNRTFVPYDSLSSHLVKALIATEDVRYTSHAGVDFRSLARVMVKTILGGDDHSGGGSTISQQLAKQLFTNKSAQSMFERGIQKLNEWVIAVELERYYTKEEIVSLYLNQFDFLYNAIGVKTASRVYFNTTPADLKIEEAAILVGMLKNPALYNPKKFPENMKGRRNVVFAQMLKADYISQADFDSLKQLPITIDFQNQDHKEVPAAYFRQYLNKIMRAHEPIRKNYASEQKFFEDSIEWAHNGLYGWCNKNLKPDGTPYNLYTDGLRIYTTIDSRMQKYAEEAVINQLKNNLQPAFNNIQAHNKYAPYAQDIASTDKGREEMVDVFVRRTMRYTDRYMNMKKRGASDEEIDEAFNTKHKTHVFTWNGVVDTVMTPRDSILHMKKHLRSGMMSMNPINGHVKAYVGGPNFRYFMYDMVTQGKRQIGSTIKPFLYTLAMQEGFSPCYQVQNIEYTVLDALGRSWTPRNVGKAHYGEMVTLRYGLATSNNFISAWLMTQFTAESLASLIHSMGVTSHIDPTPSLCLGTPDFSIKELVAAYSVFANKGVYTSPVFVTRIEDNHGNIISTFQPERKEIIDEQTAYLMLNMLEGVVNMGSGYALRDPNKKYHFTAQMGGKTGTTQSYSDGWYSGVTPKLITSVWVGGEERSIRFDNYLGYGGRMALPIWGDYMMKLYEDEELGYSQEDEFEKPENFNMNLNCEELISSSSKEEEDMDQVTSAEDEGLF